MREVGEYREALSRLAANRLAELRRWDCVSQPPAWIYAMADDDRSHLLLWAMAHYSHSHSSLAQQMASHDKGGMMSLRMERLLSADLRTHGGRSEYCRTLRALYGLGCRSMGMSQVWDLLCGDGQGLVAIAHQYYTALGSSGGDHAAF